MQLKSLAKTTEALDVINKSSKSIIELTDIGTKYTRETLKTAIAQSTLNKTQIEAILTANGLQGELLETTVDELANATSTNALSASQTGTTATTLGLGTAFKGLGIQIKNTTTAMLTWLATNPIGWIAAVGAAIYGAVKLYDALTVSLEEQKEKLKEAKEAYENVKNELKEIESELQSNKDAIKELEALPNLTWVEQEELNRLREVTKELELQKKLKQEEQLRAAEDLYQENLKTFNKEFGSSLDVATVDGLKQLLSSKNISAIQLDLENSLVDIEAMLQYLSEEKEKLTDASEIESYEQMIDDLMQRKNELIKNKGQEALSSLSEYKQNILNIASVRDLTEEEQATYDYFTSLQKMIYEFYSPATWNN